MFFFIYCLISTAKSNDLDFNNSLISEWSKILDDHFLPFISHGISQELIDETFLDGGSSIIFQYLNHTLYLTDPFGYCLCNNTNYSHSIKFEFHFRRCQIIADLLTIVLKHSYLPDFEFVFSLDDLPKWTILPTSTPNWKPKPGFGSVRCWNKAGFALPFFGSHQHFDLKDLDFITEIVNNNRKKQAIFRGGIHRGCSFEKDSILDFHGDIVFSMSNRSKPCGRQLLFNIASQNSHLINYQDQWISLPQQANIYQYVISAEGFGGWTDRLLYLLKSNMIVFDQEHPCDQWFEPILIPFLHYIPVAHDFRNLVGKIAWANQHPYQVTHIQNNARHVSKKYLSSQGVLNYLIAILTKYVNITKYKPILRKHSIPVTLISNPEFRHFYCSNLPS